MPPRQPSRSRAIGMLRIVVWGMVWALALFGLFFLGLTLAGAVQFAMLECGPRHTWSETNYLDCSDIDETNPIFFAIGLLAVAPLIVALLFRFFSRRSK